jgi:gas vesicle protein
MAESKIKADSSADRIIIIMLSMFAGFILGLLFAPQSGRKFRKDLAIKLKDLIDRGKFTLVEAKVISVNITIITAKTYMVC